MFIRTALMREMEYRVEFFISMLHVLLWSTLQVVFYRVIFANVDRIGSWDFPQMLVLVGTFMILDSILFTFIFRNLGNFDNLVRRGELDRVLVRPVDSQFMVSLYYLMPKESVNVFLGSFVVVYGLNAMHFVPGAAAILGYLIFLVCSVLVIYSLSFILSCLAFYFEKAEDLHELVISLWQFAKLPDVFTGPVKILFMSLAPIVFASYVPSGLLLGKVDSWFLVYYFLTSLFLFWFARVFWKLSLKKYKSAGG